MKGLLLGLAAGYVLGTRAGRARYEEIVKNAQRMMDHPAVQGVAGVVRAKVSEFSGKAESSAHSVPERRSSAPYGKNPTEREPGASISASRVNRS